MTTRAQIVAEAREWVGTPFHHQAAKKQVGCDCIGLLRGMGERFEIEGYRELMNAREFAAYGMDPDPVLLLAGSTRFLDEIPFAQVRVADVLLFKTRYSLGLPKHFGIVSGLDPMYMIHAWALAGGKVSENRVDATWRARILRCFRFKGLAD